MLILTTFDVDEYAFAGLRAGASGFLLKDTRPADLVEAIRTVAAGDAVVSPRITRRMLELFGPHLPGAGAPEPGGPDPRLERLTARELEVLTLVAEGLSNAEIAGRLFVSETTVKTHVGNLLGKLELRDRVQAVVLAYETGLVRPTERTAPRPRRSRRGGGRPPRRSRAGPSRGCAARAGRGRTGPGRR